eukprot:TRINITY_DN6254_c0_g1_i2.p1 TRINITY_DN6254_c0_g1~~TRINITY_DN6254_c0_g1_i2.p1  ORF type:complete len:916 (+),score=140.28 TRINITY_DN6254_c0_g1_i2:94-2841(+)
MQDDGKYFVGPQVGRDAHRDSAGGDGSVPHVSGPYLEKGQEHTRRRMAYRDDCSVGETNTTDRGGGTVRPPRVAAYYPKDGQDEDDIRAPKDEPPFKFSPLLASRTREGEKTGLQSPPAVPESTSSDQLCEKTCLRGIVSEVSTAFQAHVDEFQKVLSDQMKAAKNVDTEFRKLNTENNSFRLRLGLLTAPVPLGMQQCRLVSSTSTVNSFAIDADTVAPSGFVVGADAASGSIGCHPERKHVVVEEMPRPVRGSVSSVTPHEGSRDRLQPNCWTNIVAHEVEPPGLLATEGNDDANLSDEDCTQPLPEHRKVSTCSVATVGGRNSTVSKASRETTTTPARDSAFFPGDKFEVLREWITVITPEARVEMEEWERESKLCHKYASTSKPPSFMKMRSKTVQIGREEDATKPRKFSLKWFTVALVIHPYSMIRATWDVFSMLLVFRDMVFIPLQTFDPPTFFFELFLTELTRIFWTVDIFMSFTTGYVSLSGEVELDLTKISWRYFKRYFLMDMFIVLSDWVEVVLLVHHPANNANDVTRFGRVSRVMRIFRMVRLLRFVRLRETLSLLTERIQSERGVIVADVLKLISGSIAIAHFFACIWYGISRGKAGEGAESGNWLDDAGIGRRLLAYRYFVSMHWSVSQFTGGMDEVKPVNTAERVFAIGVFIAGFIICSLFQSSLTSSMTRLNIIGSHEQQNLASLRKYLRQNGISSRLSIRVQRNAVHAKRMQEHKVPENAVAMFNLISEPLRIEVHFELYSACIVQHPFFARYVIEYPQVMRKVCHFAMETVMVASGDTVFDLGEIPAEPKMYFVISGCLRYEQISRHATIARGDWCSEGTIWTTWMHRGMLVGEEDSKLAVLDSVTFRRIAQQFRHRGCSPAVYAAAFVKELNGLHNKEVSDLPTHIHLRQSEIEDDT